MRKLRDKCHHYFWSVQSWPSRQLIDLRTSIAKVGNNPEESTAETFKQFKPQKLSISNNIIDNTSTGNESFNGIRLHSVGYRYFTPFFNTKDVGPIAQVNKNR